MNLRISILDSHTMFLQAIAHYIKSKLFNLEIVSRCNEASQLFKSVKIDNPDVILLELNICDRDGIEILEDLKNYNKELKIIVLSAYKDPKFVRKAMVTGADAFIYKGNDISEINKAIYEVSNGNTYLGYNVRTSPSSDRRSDSSFNSSSSDSFTLKQRLTKREKEILENITLGKNNKQIGSELYISYQTVGVHRKNIMKKLGVRNTVSLIKLAIDRELV